jgi:ribosomal protein S18 acetylase RimI-like enzyme
MAVGKEETIAFSEIDSERFGVRVARAQVEGKDLRRIINFCVAEQIRLLIARCATEELRTIQEMETLGFLLMDTLVYYSFDLTKRTIPDDASSAHVRKFERDDAAQVEAAAAAAFKGYFGHYHADSRLDQGKCDEGYVSWAVRSCTSKQVATEVLVAEKDKRIVGFLTLRLNSPKEMEGLLFGVVPEGRGIGVGRSLMVNGLQLCKKQQVKRMLISTQVTNVAVQRVWCRVGFEPAHSFYTLHKWF